MKEWYVLLRGREEWVCVRAKDWFDDDKYYIFEDAEGVVAELQSRHVQMIVAKGAVAGNFVPHEAKAYLPVDEEPLGVPCE